MTDAQDQQDPLERQEDLGRRENQVAQDNVDHLDPLLLAPDRRDRRERVDPEVCRDQLDHLDLPDHRV